MAKVAVHNFTVQLLNTMNFSVNPKKKANDEGGNLQSILVEKVVGHFEDDRMGPVEVGV